MISREVTLAGLPEAARELIQAANGKTVWALKGDMGSGKTTLAGEICRQLGVPEPTASPTFSIINEYPLAPAGVVYHFDCYRLNSEAEALDIGVEEYLASGHLCLIEWPEKIQGLLPHNTFLVELRRLDPATRLITYTK
jgi:tRNA threonylcarbamoyladenosine biosynthesis protein TsaE